MIKAPDGEEKQYNMKTHKVIDLTATEEEGKTMFVGNEKECYNFISEQGDSGYKVERMTKLEIAKEQKTDYWCDTVVILVGEFQDEIVEAIKNGVLSLFGNKLPKISVKANCDEWVGVKSFEVFIKDENGKSVFASEIEVALKTDNLRPWDVNEKIELDHSIYSVRVTSNKRELDNPYELAQMQIAAFIMSKQLDCATEFNNLFASYGKSIKDAYGEFATLSKIYENILKNK